MQKFYLRDGVFNLMSDFNNFYKKSLKQANNSFWVGIGSGITGLLFFVATLTTIYFADANKNFTALNENFEQANDQLNYVIGLLDNIEPLDNNEESDATNNEESDDINKLRDELDDLENKLDDLSIQAQKDLTRFSNNSFVIVSLLGGGFLEIIAIVNFYQYGKLLAKNSDSIDRNQIIHLAYSTYQKLENESEKIAFLDLMPKIIPNVQSPPTDTKHPNKSKNNGRPKQSSDSEAVKS